MTVTWPRVGEVSWARNGSILKIETLRLADRLDAVYETKRRIKDDSKGFA